MELKHIGMVSSVQSAVAGDSRVKKEKAVSDERKDQLHLSGTVKDMMETRRNARVELMKTRVESGYYLTEEVTEKTAEKILKSL